jgi:nickel transport protein
MAWNKVRVFGPGDEKTEFVVARTDRNGRFAFLPDRPGLWRVEASDDEGHKAVAETEYRPAASSGASSAMAAPGSGSYSEGAGPPWMRAVLGVSLVLNLFVGAAFLKRKS